MKVWTSRFASVTWYVTMGNGRRVAFFPYSGSVDTSSVDAAAAAKTTSQHAVKISSEDARHGVINEKVEEAADHASYVLRVVEVKIVGRGGIGDLVHARPKRHLEHDIRDITNDENDDESQSHLAQVTDALTYRGRVVF